MTEEMGQGGLFDVYVVDGRGRLVAHSDPERLEGDLDVSEVEIVRQFLDSQGRAGATVPFTIQTPRRHREDARHLHRACRTTRAGASSSRSTRTRPTTARSRCATSRWPWWPW